MTRLNDNITITQEVLDVVKEVLNQKFPNSKDKIDQINLESFKKTKTIASTGNRQH